MGEKKSELATLGGGCFWCLEPVFEELEGVESVAVGYAGGTTEAPSYAEVTRGSTGHAEVIQIEFDPGVISFEDILGVFFSVHDPTTLNRQGADIGTQYRSVILFYDSEQENTARSLIERLDSEQVFENPIVTEVQPFKAFYEAEDYHQNYYEKNPTAGYCMVVIAPKMQKFRKLYTDRLKKAQPQPG